jgi:hypothetical protein
VVNHNGLVENEKSRVTLSFCQGLSVMTVYCKLPLTFSPGIFINIFK